MVNSNSETVSPAGFTPPTSVGETRQPESRSSWPGVIGIIAIIFGILATLGGIMGFLAPFILDKMGSALPDNSPRAIKLSEAQVSWVMISSSLTVILAVLLLVAGVGLLSRRRWAVKAAMVWAVLKMLYVVVVTMYNYNTLPQQIESISKQNPGAASMPAGSLETFAIVGLVVGLLWYWALPVFMLIWFRRKNIRDEIVGWSPARDSSERFGPPLVS
ncbi:MAG: hypothetical protein KAV82_14085 [Phycisphaerae bacterium]|nr:hypothetical protein [Phycisphaerae bacterium]